MSNPLEALRKDWETGNYKCSFEEFCSWYLKDKAPCWFSRAKLSEIRNSGNIAGPAEVSVLLAMASALLDCRDELSAKRALKLAEVIGRSSLFDWDTSPLHMYAEIMKNGAKKPNAKTH